MFPLFLTVFTDYLHLLRHTLFYCLLVYISGIYEFSGL